MVTTFDGISSGSKTVARSSSASSSTSYAAMFGILSSRAVILFISKLEI
ncbi:conserved hypothetical protein [Vibrio parahaemolyticus AN-5034]|nr:conserved hypothetical protein [Vibrio parahaemolyticus AN-5034]